MFSKKVEGTCDIYITANQKTGKIYIKAPCFPFIQQVSMVTKNIHIVHMYLVCTALVHRVKQPKSYVDNGVIGGFGSEDFRDVKHNKFGNGIRFQRQKLGNQKMIPLKKLTLESFTSSVFK